jgi:hypothetical protein
MLILDFQVAARPHLTKRSGLLNQLAASLTDFFDVIP